MKNDSRSTNEVNNQVNDQVNDEVNDLSIKVNEMYSGIVDLDFWV